MNNTNSTTYGEALNNSVSDYSMKATKLGMEVCLPIVVIALCFILVLGAAALWVAHNTAPANGAICFFSSVVIFAMFLLAVAALLKQKGREDLKSKDQVASEAEAMLASLESAGLSGNPFVRWYAKVMKLYYIVDHLATLTKKQKIFAGVQLEAIKSLESCTKALVTDQNVARMISEMAKIVPDDDESRAKFSKVKEMNEKSIELGFKVSSAKVIFEVGNFRDKWSREANFKNGEYDILCKDAIARALDQFYDALSLSNEARASFTSIMQDTLDQYLAERKVE